MQDRSDAAFRAYLAAKGRMFAQDPGFRVDRVGPLWCLRHHPGWPEKDAYYGLNVGPFEAAAVIASDGSPQEHRLTLLQKPRPDAISICPPGYRLEERPQPFLCRWLDQADNGPRAVPVVDEAGLVFVNVPSPYMKVEELRGGVYRYYYLEVDGVAACRGRCVDIEGAIYVAGLDTLPEFRRRGLGHALMRTMEVDAFSRGKPLATLWSSAIGRGMYRSLGYEEWMRTEVYDLI